MSYSTSDLIKQHALQLFAQKGYFGTSLNDVASLVGIKKPKDDLYITILQELMDTFIDRVAIDSLEIQSSSTKPLLKRLLINMIDFWKDETLGLLYKRTLLFPEEKFRSSIHEHFLQTESYTTDILSNIFSKGLQNGEIPPQPLEPLIDAYYCLIDGLFVQRFFYSSSDFDKKAEHAFEHFWKATEIGGK